VTRFLTALACLAAAISLALPAVRSGARFNSRSSNPNDRVSADNPVNYLRLYSQSSDPAGLTGYGTKRLSNPLVPAATGADDALTVALGAYKNDNGTTVNRALTLQAVSPLPAGASPLTVSASLAPDQVTGRQPLSQVTISDTDGANAATTATMTAGAKKQLNVLVTTKAFPGNNKLHTPIVTLTVTHPGYAGTFLNYTVPVSVWDGNGAAP
jgi:hypothetical protein